MIEIINGRIYFYVKNQPETPTRDFKLLSGYVCPECRMVLRAYFVGYMVPEAIGGYTEKETLKYAYEAGAAQGGQWIALHDHNHKSVCSWEIAGGSARGIEQSVDSYLKIHSIEVKDREGMISAISAGSLTGFKLIQDEARADLPILIYNRDELIDAANLEFKEKWKRMEKIGEYIDAKIKKLKKGSK